MGPETGLETDTPPVRLVAEQPLGLDLDSPPAETSESVQSAALETEEKVYQYDHGGGRQYEGTLANAQRICPALGRMSLQEAGNALAKADVAERLAAKGRERRLASAAADQPEPAAPKPAKPTVEKAPRHDTHKPATIAPVVVQEGLATAALANAAPPSLVGRADRLSVAKESVVSRETLGPTVSGEVAAYDESATRHQPVESKANLTAARRVDIGATPIMTPASIATEQAPMPLAAAEVPLADILPFAHGVPEADRPETVMLELETADEELAVSDEIPSLHSAVREVLPAEAHADETGGHEDVSPLLALSAPFPIQAGLPAESPEIAPLTIAPEEEPLRVYEKLTKTLHAYTATAEAPPVDMDTEIAGVPAQLRTAIEQEMAEAPTETEPVPAVVILVAERLDELAAEKKDAVASVLQEVVAAAHVARVLETDAPGAEMSEPEAAVTKLEEQVSTLFQQLGIEYEPEDIEQFATVLLQSEFQLPQAAEEAKAVDLEHEGTREARVHWTQFASGIVGQVEQDIKRLLGTVVLTSYAA